MEQNEIEFRIKLTDNSEMFVSGTMYDVRDGNLIILSRYTPNAGISSKTVITIAQGEWKHICESSLETVIVKE